MRKTLFLLLAGIFLFPNNPAQAAVSPLSVAVFPPVQFPPEDFAVTGARLSVLMGRHRSVYGIDVGGIGNITDQNFVGIAAAGVFNANNGMTTIIGLQAAGAMNLNKNKADIYGLQLALGLNSNQAASSLYGLQAAVIGNLSPYTIVHGLQVGLYNKAQEVYGFQIGLINSCSSLHGLQIGLLNFHDKGIFAVSPLLNFGF